MPVVLALIVVILAGIAFMALMLPLSIVMRYRAGAARRRAWGWVTSLNMFLSMLSAVILLVSAGISNIWIPDAFRYTIYGMGAGSLLGICGLMLTRWETTVRGLFYTPSRLLILAITLVVSARIFYGFWRGWHAWQTTADTQSWLAASGAAGSLGAGAAVLGYYVVYWMGVRFKILQFRKM